METPLRPSLSSSTKRPSTPPRAVVPSQPLRRSLGTALTLLLLLVGFIVSSCLAGLISANRWWMLIAGLLVSFVLPVVIASWIRSLRRRSGGATPTGAVVVRSPTSLGSVAIANALLLLVCCLAAPSTTRRAIYQHGTWWVEQISRGVKRPADNAVVRTTGSALRYLADLLGRPPPTADDGTGSASPRSATDGAAVALTPDATRPRPSPDLGPPLPAGEVRVAFQKRGNAIIVPVELQGASGTLTRKMLFDTGASLSTIDEKTLRSLGQWVSADDPTIETHTANGVVQRKLTVIEALTLGGSRVGGGLAVSVCDPCAAGDVVGLLGLNVQRHFKVTIDHEAGQLVLAPKRPPVGHLVDIQPFVELKQATGTWRGALLSVSLTVSNRAPRGVRRVRVAAVVKAGDKEGRVWGELPEVSARSQAPMKIEGLSPIKGTSFLLKLEQVEW
jgi:hypothetical protein